jgi:cytochrome c oxidase subunit 2
MKRDVIIAGGLWLLLTAVGETLAVFIRFYPDAKSDKGQEIETAFRALVFFAIPVLTMVVTVLLYTVLRHRVAGPPTEDGPGYRGRGAVPLAWFGVTAGLTLVIMIYPGLVGIPGIIADPQPDLVVDVKGVQWTWLISYPDQQITGSRELVLPVDHTIRFDITSLDVIHSFWVPAFLMKTDALPGRTTTVTLRPTEIGSFQTNSLYRLQCAELCGLGHSQMRLPVRVVSEQEFEQWVKERQAAAAAEQPTPTAGAQEFTVVGENTSFDVTNIEVEAGRQVTVTLDNRDAGVPHNWALYDSEQAANSGAAAIAATSIEAGPNTQSVTFDAPEPGTYFFRCDVHPTLMTGTLVVK